MTRMGAMAIAVLAVVHTAAQTGSPTTAPASLLEAGAVSLANSGLNVLYIDQDKDGYGVGCPKGPDADDSDPTVTTYESAIQKYGDAKAFVNHLGYHPDRILEGPMQGPLRPGDLVIVPAGTNGGKKYCVDLEQVHGTADKPIVFLAKPGERVVYQAKTNAIMIQHCSNLVLDGFIIDGSAADYGIGIMMHWSQNVTFRRMEVSGWDVGMQAAQDLHNVLIEKCVFHDQRGSHGIYLASRDRPNSDLTVRDCLLYRNKNGFQHNGRVTHLLMEGNIIHSNWLAGISWLQGVSDSTIRNNLIFNNGTQGIVINLYDDSPTSGIFPYDQSNNRIENNTIWVGKTRPNPEGPYDPMEQPAVQINDSTQKQVRMMNATIRNNILVTYAGPAFRIDPTRFAAGTTIEQNLICKLVPQDNYVMLCEQQKLEFPSLGTSGCVVKDNVFADPAFKDASVDYAQTPEKFNFGRKF